MVSCWRHAAQERGTRYEPTADPSLHRGHYRTHTTANCCLLPCLALACHLLVLSGVGGRSRWRTCWRSAPIQGSPPAPCGTLRPAGKKSWKASEWRTQEVSYRHGYSCWIVRVRDGTGTGLYGLRDDTGIDCTVRVRDGYGTVRVRVGIGCGTGMGQNDGSGAGLCRYGTGMELNGYASVLVRDGYGNRRVWDGTGTSQSGTGRVRYGKDAVQTSTGRMQD